MNSGRRDPMRVHTLDDGLLLAPRPSLGIKHWRIWWMGQTVATLFAPPTMRLPAVRRHAAMKLRKHKNTLGH